MKKGIKQTIKEEKNPYKKNEKIAEYSFLVFLGHVIIHILKNALYSAILQKPAIIFFVTNATSIFGFVMAGGSAFLLGSYGPK